MAMIFNTSPHGKSYKGMRYTTGGSGPRIKHYGTPERTKRYLPGWTFERRDNIGVETLLIVQQKLGGVYVVNQSLNGKFVAQIEVRESTIRQKYVKV